MPVVVYNLDGFSAGATLAYPAVSMDRYFDVSAGKVIPAKTAFLLPPFFRTINKTAPIEPIANIGSHNYLQIEDSHLVGSVSGASKNRINISIYDIQAKHTTTHESIKATKSLSTALCKIQDSIYHIGRDDVVKIRNGKTTVRQLPPGFNHDHIFSDLDKCQALMFLRKEGAPASSTYESY
jgi:hypothetical protein